MKYSVIIPARNERDYILQTIEGLECAIHNFHSGPIPIENRSVEIILVDDASTDGTSKLVQSCYGERVRIFRVSEGSCGRSRNRGASIASGSVLVFVDADTIVPATLFFEIEEFCKNGKTAGLYSLCSREPGITGKLWWCFWGYMRALPLARAKAMPACSFVTRIYFDESGGFDEQVAITEEWSIFAALYQKASIDLQCYTQTKARTSSRRIDSLTKGARMFLRWSLAIIDPGSRRAYPKFVNHPPPLVASNRNSLTDRVLNFFLRISEINSIRVDENFVYKKRRFYAPIIIRAANLIFSAIGEPLRILRDVEWNYLEAARFESLYDFALSSTAWIHFPRLGGVSLRSYLREESFSSHRKLLGVQSAAAALSRLHAKPIGQLHAHGDAHAGNVLFETESGKAHWFDFETTLDGNLLRTEQIAYDLSVFLLSVIEDWPAAPVSEICAAITAQHIYGDPEIVSALVTTLARLSSTPTIFERVRFYGAIHEIGHLYNTFNAELSRILRIGKTNAIGKV